jgi:type I restriction enzyme S subunit
MTTPIDNKHKKLNVPNLRFPEFTGEWEKQNLESITSSVSSGKSHAADGEYNLYGSTGIIGKTDKGGYEGNLVLVARVGANAGYLQIINEKCGITDNTLIITPGQISACYIYNYLQHFNLNRLIFGSGQPLITGSMLKKVPISFGTYEEQKKIAGLLYLLDERISTQNKIIEDLKKLKSAIIEKLYSGIQGKECSYGQLFEVVNERNKQMEYSNILSASQEKGMVNRHDLNLDIQFESSNINTYKIVREGDYIIHLRSFQGGFAFSDKLGVCSPAYTILRPNSLLEYGYLSYYFTSHRFIKSLITVTYGIRDGRSINVEEWLKMKVVIPSREDQLHLLKVLRTIGGKVENEEAYATCLSNQKQYLLRQMFV